MRLIDLDGNTWDGRPLHSKYRPLYDARGRNEMMGVTLGWLEDAPEFDLEEHEKKIRNKTIDEFANFIHEKAKENNGLRLSGETRSWTHASIFDYVNEFREKQMKGENNG